MLHLHQLSKRYDTSLVFEHVDLDASGGEVLAILGESGVGKSTLLNVIAGLDSASSGSVVVAGTDLSTLNERQLALWRRAHLGFVFQAFHLLPHLSVAQNVALPLLLLGARDDARVAQMLGAVGLAGFELRAPRTLSGGQLQRVAIARALVHRPALVLADEPTGNLDAKTADAVLDLLVAQAREHQATCLLVTHSSAAAARADRALRLTPEGMVVA